jgi:hypothetical protein
MPKELFIEQLKARGYNVREPFKDFIVIDFMVDTGRFFGQEIQLGFARVNSFPDIPPGGPNFNKHLKPFNNTSNTHPDGGIHYSKAVFTEIGLTDEWQYWSRPFPDWKNTDRTVDIYFAHLRHLLDTI